MDLPARIKAILKKYLGKRLAAIIVGAAILGWLTVSNYIDTREAAVQITQDYRDRFLSEPSIPAGHIVIGFQGDGEATVIHHAIANLRAQLTTVDFVTIIDLDLPESAELSEYDQAIQREAQILNWLDETGAAAAYHFTSREIATDSQVIEFDYYTPAYLDGDVDVTPAWYYPPNYRLPHVLPEELAGVIEMVARFDIIGFAKSIELNAEFDLGLPLFADRYTSTVESFRNWSARACGRRFSFNCDSYNAFQTFLSVRKTEAENYWRFASRDEWRGAAGGHLVIDPEDGRRFDFSTVQSARRALVELDAYNQQMFHAFGGDNDGLFNGRATLKKKLDRTTYERIPDTVPEELPGLIDILEIEKANLDLRIAFNDFRRFGVGKISNENEEALANAILQPLERLVGAAERLSKEKNVPVHLRLKAILIAAASVAANKVEVNREIAEKMFSMLNENYFLAAKLAPRMPNFSTTYVLDYLRIAEITGHSSSLDRHEISKINRQIISTVRKAVRLPAMDKALQAQAINMASYAAETINPERFCGAIDRWYQAARLPGSGLRYSSLSRELFDLGVHRSLKVLGEPAIRECFEGLSVDVDRVLADALAASTRYSEIGREIKASR